MKYINILTIHNEPNYGALLQAYALYHTVEQLGYTPRMIDLHIIYRAHSYSYLNRVLMGINNWLKGYNFCYKKSYNFSKKMEPNRIGPFYSYKQLCQQEWESEDVYLIGSDQVWNTEITHNLKKAFTFSFLPKCCNKKCSYAASFGNIKDERERAESLDITNTLKTFYRIGIREDFGSDFLKKYDIESKVVIDPTLLLCDYSHLLDGEIEHSGNLLYLSLGHAPKMDAFTKDVSDKLGLPIELRYGYLQPSKKINKEWLSVGQWLQRIASAEMVITDSFHATVFAIMFERPFYVYISNPSKSFRITNILKKFGLEDRIVNNTSQVDKASKIDYKIVKERIKNLRDESLIFLSQTLSEISSI